MATRAFHVSFGLINKLLLALMLAALGACGGGDGDSSDGTFVAGGSESATGAGNETTAPAVPSPGSAAPDRIAGPGLVAGQPILVNTTVSGTQTLAAIGAQADGGYAVSWVSGANASAPPVLYVQHFDASGGKVGAETPVQIDIGALNKPAIAVTSDGGVLVAYVASTPVSAAQPWIVQWAVYSRRFDPGGVAVGGETVVQSFVQNLISARITYSFADVAVVAWRDGSYLIGWAYVESSYLGKVPTFSLRLYDRAGSPLGDAFGAAHGDIGTTFGLTAIPGGGYVRTTFYHDFGGDYALFDLLGSTGVAGRIGAYYEPASGRLPENRTTLLPLVDGRFALWSANPGGPYRQMFDPGGNPVESPTPVTSLPTVASALSDGGYVTFTRVGDTDLIDVQRFSAAGAQLGGAFQMQLPTEARTLTTRSLVDGGLVMGWTMTDSTGNQDVYVQRFEEADAQ